MDRRFPNSDRKARETAALFGWDETFISKLVRGERRPGLENAVQIERTTGIPAESWLANDADNLPEPIAMSAVKRSRTK